MVGGVEIEKEKAKKFSELAKRMNPYLEIPSTNGISKTVFTI